MKKLLYITNIQAPYRVQFFNGLSKLCDLTVLYERSRSSNRDISWSHDPNNEYKRYYLDGFKIGRETSFSFSILKYIFGNYDLIIIGCYNSPVQMFAMILMRIFHKKFIISTDGELFIGNKGIKDKIKKYFLKGATAYLTAGVKSSDSLRNAIGNKRIVPYFFSSLSEEEIEENKLQQFEREDFILVVGQYYEYKGLDVAVEVARKMPDQKFVFVGTGNRTDLFIEECKLKELENIIVIPFLQKKELYEQYMKCKCLLLPTRQECWGLVINEAASFGTPIVSTWGSGAAVEFLGESYKCYLSASNSVFELSKIIEGIGTIDANYEKYLKEKSKNYSIEHSVNVHIELINALD